MNTNQIYALINKLQEERVESADNLTIGEFLEKLNQFDDNEKVVFSNGKHFDGTYDSYRGYYQDLYIGISDSDVGLDAVGSIKKTLNEALECGEMTGYKGGDFSIHEGTLVWFSTYGSTGDNEMITDVQEVDGIVVVVLTEE
jgi:hypothetical protein